MSETSIQHEDKHERRDVDARRLLLFAVVFALFIGVSVAILWFVLGVHQDGFAPAEPLGKVSDDSELQQRDQLNRYLTEQRGELDRLAWTDDGHRTAKVPIADAMALLAGKGDKR